MFDDRPESSAPQQPPSGGEDTNGQAGPPAPRRTGRGLVIGAAGAATAILVVGVFFGIKLFGDDASAVAGQPGNAETGQPKASDEIRQFDFKNATVDNGFGEKQTLSDGSYTLPGHEGTHVGTKMIEGPVFADVDDDGDLDAAAIYRWTPSAGTPVTIAFIWEWTGDTAKQVVQPIMAGWAGTVAELEATKTDFAMTMVSRVQPPDAGTEPESERVAMALHDGYVAQTRPHFGAADRCVVFDNSQKLGTVAENATARIAPESDAPEIESEEPFLEAVAIEREMTPQDWNLARLTSRDGSVRCGWVSADDVEK